MIKKISAFFAAALLLCSVLSGTAFATFVFDYVNPDLPQPDIADVWSDVVVYPNPGFQVQSYPVSSYVSSPVITTEPTGFSNTRGSVPEALRVSAASYDGGYLSYQWYMSYTGSYYDMYPIEGATGSAYTPEANLGTMYYCVGICNVLNGGRSTEVFSNIVTVTYSGIEIVRNPSRLSYSVGSGVELAGLQVRIHDGAGGTWDSVDGSGLSVYPTTFQSAGSVAVQVSYGASSDVFYVTVSGKAAAGSSGTKTVNADGTVTEDGPHTHAFGDWEITKPSTCVTTGTQVRSCVCGETETEEIPRAEHDWDDGVITKEATATANGARLYTCKVCKANKSEIIPAGTVSDEVSKQMESMNIDSGKTAVSPTTAPLPSPTQSVTVNNTGAAVSENAASGTVSNNGDGSGWWLIPVSALLLVGTGTGAYYVMRKKTKAE